MTEKNGHQIYTSISAENAENTLRATLADCGATKNNTELIIESIKWRSGTKSLKEITTQKFYYTWSAVTKLIDVKTRELNAVTQTDIIEMLSRVEKTAVNEWTKEDYIQKLKIFYRWLRDEKELSAETHKAVNYILNKYVFKKDEDKMPSRERVTIEQTVKLISAAEALNQKALIGLLWMSGCRISELLTLQIQDLKPVMFGVSQKGYVLQLRKSKTVKRPVPIMQENYVHAARYLRLLLQQRQNQGARPDEPLFINQKGEGVNYACAKKWLNRASQRAGVARSVHFHAFRKGRATDLANSGWSEAQMNKLFGWKQGSRTSAFYVQEAGIDVIQKMAETYGLAEVEIGRQASHHCGGCGTENPQGADICHFCGQALTFDALQRQEAVLLDSFKHKYAPEIERLLSRFEMPIEGAQ